MRTIKFVYFVIVLLLVPAITRCSDELVPEGSSENNPCVYKVERAFDYLPARTDQYFAAWTNSYIQPPKYQQIQSNQYKGIWGGLNHFQSIKRLPAHLGLGNYFAITGSDPNTPAAHLFIMHIGSMPKKGRLHKNTNHNSPAHNDHLIYSSVLDKQYWHVGGIDVAGKYLAIPLNDQNDSKVIFFDVQDPENPQSLKVCVNRPSRNSIAVALTKLSSGQFVLAVWTDGLKNNSRGLDFYFSRTRSLIDGFEDSRTLHVADIAFSQFMQKQNYQNINFVNDFEGNVYLVATGNSSATAPLKAGIDHADLFLVTFKRISDVMKEHAAKYEPSSVVNKLEEGSLIPQLTFLKEKHMYCKQGICNFNAGATIYIPDQQHIFLYSLPHWLTNNGKFLNFAQYASIQRTYPE